MASASLQPRVQTEREYLQGQERSAVWGWFLEHAYLILNLGIPPLLLSDTN